MTAEVIEQQLVEREDVKLRRDFHRPNLYQTRGDHPGHAPVSGVVLGRNQRGVRARDARGPTAAS